jgi:hypothetical protein
MADTKISNLTAVTDVLTTDEYVVARAGTTKKISGANFIAANPKAMEVIFHHPKDAATGAFSNLAASTVGAVSDPSYRAFTSLVGFTKVRFLGRLGGSIVAATKLRIQYHTSSDPTVATGDAGWTTLTTSAGSHTLSALFLTAEEAVPSGARINPVQIRAVLFDGDGVADPTMTCLRAFFYN